MYAPITQHLTDLIRYMIVYVLYATDVKSDMRIRVEEKKVQNVPSQRLVNVPIVNIGIVVDVACLTHFTTMARVTTIKPWRYND